MTAPEVPLVGDELAALVRAALQEDVGPGDRTTEWTVPPEMEGTARILSKAEGVVSGVEFADRVFAEVDTGLRRTWRVREGDAVAFGAEMLVLEGRLGSILTAERTALNGLAHLSGVATATAAYVEALEGTGARLVDTRKTTPGWRTLEKAATRAGGGANHRMGLHDMILIKENHIRAAGGIRAALDAVAARASEQGLPVEIEVSTLAELDEALESPPDRILLDNMSLDDLSEAVRRVGGETGAGPLLEASGGIDLESVRAVGETGVDLVSVGAITHSARALDLSLLVDR
ncbi:MAG: carboxylating nicotinate-nucleotide diphosphorylase [Gemmatimonadota bacterium]|nr:carboxylating nicotinate-nucleotide diphosphorylase [Gemmatimonadota bacterium]